jgi:hypothetical protein
MEKAEDNRVAKYLKEDWGNELEESGTEKFQLW